MKCTQASKYLPLYAGGDLPDASKRQLEEHLAACASCRRGHDEYVEALSDLKRLRRRPDLGPILEGLSDVVLSRYRQNPHAPAAKIYRPPFSGFVRVAAAAALFLVLVGGAFFLGQSSTSSSGGGRPMDSTVTDVGRFVGSGNLYLDERYREMLEEWERKNGRGENPDYDRLRPQELPSVQPASHRRGF